MFASGEFLLNTCSLQLAWLERHGVLYFTTGGEPSLSPSVAPLRGASSCGVGATPTRSLGARGEEVRGHHIQASTAIGGASASAAMAPAGGSAGGCDSACARCWHRLASAAATCATFVLGPPACQPSAGSAAMAPAGGSGWRFVGGCGACGSCWPRLARAATFALGRSQQRFGLKVGLNSFESN